MLEVTVDKAKQYAREYVNQNVHDGEDRSQCHNDRVVFSPDDLQELIDDLIDYLWDE